MLDRRPIQVDPTSQVWIGCDENIAKIESGIEASSRYSEHGFRVRERDYYLAGAAHYYVGDDRVARPAERITERR